MITRSKKKGSITIFGLWVMILVAEFLLMLLDAARYWELKRVAELQSRTAIEAVFANYCKPLWMEYHLLAAKQEDMETLLKYYGNPNDVLEAEEVSFLKYVLSDVSIQSYTVITDNDGVIFVKSVADYMKNNLLYETAKLIYGQYEALSQITNSGSEAFGDIDEAIEGLEELAKEEKDSTSRGLSSKPRKISSKEDNPLTQVKKLEDVGVLELVIEDEDTISSKKCDLTDAVSNRNREEGIASADEQMDWIDRILLQQYLVTYFSSYGNEKESHALSYELEYLIAKKDSDVENLKNIVRQLLFVRQAANMVYLLSDTAKMQEIQLLASAIGGASMNPALGEVVKVALITAWAFGESVLDVRALMQGKRVALLKSKELWTLELSEIGTLLDGYTMAKESPVGLSYKDYLGIFLLGVSPSKLAMRAMDMQEKTINTVEGYEALRFDHLICEASVEFTYSYENVFDIFHFLERAGELPKEFKIKSSYRYSREEVH